MVDLVDSNREKSMFFVNLSGLLFGFLLLGITSDGAVALINTSMPLLLLFCGAATCLASSMICGLFVYSGVFSTVSHVFALMLISFMFLVVGLISVLCFIFMLVMGNGFFYYILGFLLVTCNFWFIVWIVYKIYLMRKSG